MTEFTKETMSNGRTDYLSLEQLKNPEVCAVIESKINEIIDKINKKKSIEEKDPLDCELRILDWIMYQVCSNKITNL